MNRIFLIYLSILLIYALQSRKTCFEGLWATCAHSQKIQVPKLCSDLHIGDYIMIVSVNCSD